MKEYQELPEHLREQLSKITKIFLSNRIFREKAIKSIQKKFNITDKNLTKQERNIVIELYILKKISPFQILSNEILFRIVYCYEEKGNIIILKNIIKVGKHACVLLGYLKKRDGDYKKIIDESLGLHDSEENFEVVVKWYKSERHSIDFESSIYRRLSQLYCPLPFFSTKFKFWNEDVLVIEKLTPIDMNDNPYDIGIHIIYQLFFLHKFGVHCDIKPQNIMKKYKNGNPQYFLIDFGGVAIESLNDGFRRWLWSPKWTSQKPHQKNQVVYPIHDLIELGFTMNYIKTKGSENFKKNFKGVLLKYMKYIRNINSYPETQDYINMIDILRKKT
jgi:serine/threonine protein kinase